MRLKQYLNESKSDMDEIGRNAKLGQMYSSDRFQNDKVKKEWMDAIREKHRAYEKIFDIVSKHYGKIRSDYNVTTLEGKAEFMNDLRKKLNKFHKFTPKFFNSLNKDKTSLVGWGNFTFNTSMDIADYLTAAYMKAKKIDNPEDHKIWFKRT